jgi:hypothetical protein
MNKKISLCPLHPKYQAKKKPGISCIYCWHNWMKTDKAVPTDFYHFLAQDREDRARFEET